MSDVETHTVETAYGPAEIETYDCDSCGNTVAFENTVEFTIGETEGRACGHCEAKGPVSFPRKTLEFALPKETREDRHGRETFGLLFHIGMAPIIFPMQLVAGFSDHGDEFEQGYATAVIVLLVWLLPGVILWAIA